ncbi:Hypothetical predicted protein [Mytilus galloprovincialis]|uniref:Methyltransferase FkbM domain-containing protein n=1 Tax=Mytilus galloprovincialis TaxID=29158 RepID=A0A8B6G606_MYTGA|nr:Hypothetical predicted protein [Mytilus galloprovincialis]
MALFSTRHIWIVVLCSLILVLVYYIISPFIRSYGVKDFVVHRGTGTYVLDHPDGMVNGTIAWSQHGQDRYIDKFLHGKRNGFFVEIGGYDGEDYSNTLFLEKERGWTGLLVEANPYMYQIMLKKDRRCYMANACISNSEPYMTLIVAGALTSVKETLTDDQRRRLKNVKKYGKADHWSHAGEKITVQCYSLLSLLKEIGQHRVDYFSLDVEGAEMMILESIDWKELDIDVLTIETQDRRDQILKFMKQAGYKWIRKLNRDDIFKKR